MSDESKARLNPMAVISGVDKSYRSGGESVLVLNGVDLLIRSDLFTVLIGPSGSGKTSLLNLIAGFDRPDAGKVIVNGIDLSGLNREELAEFRRNNIGFVFQQNSLIGSLSVMENVEYPLLIAGMSSMRRQRRVDQLLDAVGVMDLKDRRPDTLSGGQRQRVAIARALARKPKIVVADEPTASMDAKTASMILILMRRLQSRYRITFLFSSHDRGVITMADDLIAIKGGRISGIRRRTSYESAQPIDDLESRDTQPNSEEED